MQKTPDRMSRNSLDSELEMGMLERRVMPGFVDALCERRMLFKRDRIRLDDAFGRITRARRGDHVLERIGEGVNQPYTKRGIDEGIAH